MLYPSALPRSIYTIGDGMLFDEIIANMLTSEPNLCVINRVYIDETTFLTDLSWCQPEVVLLNETDKLNGNQLLRLLPRIPLTKDVRVIIMSLNDNSIRIYDRPANQTQERAGIPNTLKRVADWNELFEIIGGKQVHEAVRR